MESVAPPGRVMLSASTARLVEDAALMGCIRLLRRRRVGRMPPMITRHNPTQLHNPPGYHHVTVVEAGRLAFLAGQCPLDAFGALVGAGDIDLQIDQVAANAAAVLAAVGARPDQVVRSVVYVVSDTTLFLPRPGAGSPFRSSDRHSPPRARS